MSFRTVALLACVGLSPLQPAWAQAHDRYPVRQMSTAMHQEGFPSWSPDGRTLVFEDVEEEHYGLFKVSSEGGPPVRFTSLIGEHPRWSPDGHSSRGNPIWSPDGSRIAFKAGSAICMVEIETGDFTKAFEAAGKRPVPSCWSRDGKSVLFWMREPD